MGVKILLVLSQMKNGLVKMNFNYVCEFCS
jgi:hypothetical protein